MGGQYRSVPIGITVEGANILTRNLMIFGQGAIRSHPFMLREMEALSDPDEERGLDAFDGAVWGHAGHMLANAGRAFVRGWSGCAVAPAPDDADLPHHWQRLSRYASAFALLTDCALLTLGGALKRKEMISARLGDILSELYLLAAVLKRYEDEGRQKADRPVVDYIMVEGEERICVAFDGVLRNLPARWAALLVRLVAFPFGIAHRAPSDRLTDRVAETLLAPSAQRDRLTPGLYLGAGREDHPMKDLEEAFRLVVEAAPVEKKMREAKLKDGGEARERGVISEDEFERLARVKEAVARVVAVDAFPMEEVSPLAARQRRAAARKPARPEAAE